MMLKQSKATSESTLSYSAILGFVALSIALIVSPFYITDGWTTTKHVVPPEDRRQKRWDRTSPLPVLSSLAPKSTTNELLRPANPSKIFDDFVEPKPIPSNKPAEQKKTDMIKMIKEKLAAINKPTELAHDFETEDTFIHPAPKPAGVIVSPEFEHNESDDDGAFIHPAPNPKGYIPPEFSEKIDDEDETLLPDLEGYFDPVFNEVKTKKGKGKGKKSSKNKKKKFDISAVKSKFSEENIHYQLDRPVFPSLQKQDEGKEMEIEISTHVTYENVQHHLDTPIFPSFQKQEISEELEIDIPTNSAVTIEEKTQNTAEKRQPDHENTTIENNENTVTDSGEQSRKKKPESIAEMNYGKTTNDYENWDGGDAFRESNGDNEAYIDAINKESKDTLNNETNGAGSNGEYNDMLFVKKNIVAIEKDTQKFKPQKKKRKKKDKSRDMELFGAFPMGGDKKSPYDMGISMTEGTKRPNSSKRHVKSSHGTTKTHKQPPSDFQSKSATRPTTAPSTAQNQQWKPEFVTAPIVDMSLKYDLVSDSEAE